MATLTTSKSRDIRARVEDYLDDKFQTVADLNGLDELLERVQEQQQLLRTQLAEAQTQLTNTIQDIQQQETTLRQHVEAFQKDQIDIDHRLKTITGSTISDDAVNKFESSMTRLRRIEVAHSYLELLQDVDQLSVAARKGLTTEPRSALQPYGRLRQLSQDLQAAQPAAEGAAPHLLDQVEQQTSDIYNELKDGFVKSFQKILEQIKWPQKDLNLVNNNVVRWSDQAKLLLELQEPDLFAQNQSSKLQGPNPPAVLLPMEIMVQPLAMRFHYHFYGDRPTNRLDKPEYFLSHVLDLLDRHSTFINEMLQPVLDSRLESSDDVEMIYPDAISAFITALLPMVLEKCLSILPRIATQPQLLSHLIHELMSFDSTLRDTWGYTPIPTVFTDWKGLTWTILTEHNYFQPWLAVEKDFALKRYATIRDAPESTEIDYDGVAPGQTKPTKGAIRVNDLLETITDRYRGLSSFSQKMKFLITIQLAIFDNYHNFLRGALQAYLASSHTAGRLLQGQTKSEAYGEKALASLAKIFGSSEFLERKMSDWSEDIFFLELWNELQERSHGSSGSGTSVGRDLNMDEVAAKTSSTIKFNKSDHEADSESGALFDEAARSFRRLKEQAESEILHLLDANAHDTVQPYTRVESWASLSAPGSDPSTLAPSAALDSLMEVVSSLLGFIGKSMGPAPTRRFAKHMCSTIQNQIYDHVLLKHTFSAGGAAQLKRDIVAIGQAVDTNSNSRGVAASSMKKLEEAVVLLSLPIRRSGQHNDHEDESGWDFEADEAENDQSPDAEDQSSALDDDKVLGLWEVEKMLFRNNESARQILADLGLNHLNETDARNIVTKRVEINS